MKTVIFGKGERLAECARVLGCEPSLSKYSELVILPIPTTKDGTHLSETNTTLRELAATVGEGSFVLGYGIPSGVVADMEDAGAVVCDALGDEILLTSGRLSVGDMKIGVLGYGRIGSQLMRILLFLGAHVKVYTRQNSTRVELSGYGIDAELSSEGNYDGLDFLVNTAPHRILSQDTLRRIGESGRVIDLASGDNFPDGVEITKLGGIPGIMYPVSAGRIYAAAAVRYEGGDAS